MNLSLAFLSFTSMWLSVHGDESTYLQHEKDADAAMAKSGGSPGLSAVHPDDLQKGSSPGLRKGRKDIRRLTCGNGQVGDGTCINGECCSEWGWCGTSAEHCGTSEPTSTDSTSTVGTCGSGNVGDGICPNEGECCSEWGWCETDPEHCGTNSAALAVEAALEAHKDGIDINILVSETSENVWIQSTVYRYNDFLEGLRVMYKDGVANKLFYMGDMSSQGHLYGLVNVAAFLAQSMKETIRYNACDENSWDLVNGMYPLSNSCGQLGQSYQDYKCSESEARMECPVNPNLEITATTNAMWYGAPGPLFCGPKAKYPFTGFWDYSKECNKPWADPPETCDVYEGQKAGGFDNSSPIPNNSGRTDVEGCCFWGRGVIQTTGVCNFGKLNYYLGKQANDEGRESRYPNINFCDQPNAICDSEEHKELKWIAGMFYWVESLQSYNREGWDYISELKKFVDNGLQGNDFIDAVSAIVNRGCHSPPCASGEVDGQTERASNFFKVLKELDLVD